MEKPILAKKLTGLTHQEVIDGLTKWGPNELPSQKRQSVFSLFIGIVKEPMLLLLIGSGSIYLFIGEVKDALMLLTFVFVVIGITFYQERKTERALDALKDLSSPRALVIRNGIQERIAGRDVVPGDVLVLREGDRIPADAALLEGVNLLVDESLLTGESLPVSKSEWDGAAKETVPGGENLPFIYSGTMIVQGRGYAKVLRTGVHTELGKIGRALERVVEEDTLLQKDTQKLVKNFAIVGIVLCVIVVVIYGAVRGNWLQGFLSGLTLSMAMLPEEFGVVLMIFLALGAWRMSKHHVLTRKTAAIETLGAATVLCVDKTGTITQNKMQLQKLWSRGKEHEFTSKEGVFPEEFHHLLEYGMLASQADPFDPIEREIKIKTEESLRGTEHVHHGWKLLKEYPLSKELLALSHVWQSPDEHRFVIATKGAPEAIIDLCHLDKAEAAKIKKEVQALSEQGLRILGVAHAYFDKKILPDNQHDFAFSFAGLLGFADPIRETVPAAVKVAHAAGMRVVMITGDYPGTASHIARKIGLISPETVITGDELRAMDAQTLRKRIKACSIFARVVPEQKLAIVNALKANGEVVAMTGDGVNDAPALKSAHIGIAMGERGTDVAREAADLVLLDDDFSSIVQAVRMGRRIYGNLKKAMAYILAVHVPIAGMSFLPVLFNLPAVLLPAHIAFLELVIDPACSVVFESEPEDDDIMEQPPRSLRQSLLSSRAAGVTLLQGGSVLLGAFLVFYWSLAQGKGEADARTMSFAVLVLGNIMLILTNLSWRSTILDIIRKKNVALWWVVGGALACLAAVIYIPGLRSLFHFSMLHGEDLGIVVLVAVASVAWFEVLKMFRGQRHTGK